MVLRHIQGKALMNTQLNHRGGFCFTPLLIKLESILHSASIITREVTLRHAKP